MIVTMESVTAISSDPLELLRDILIPSLSNRSEDLITDKTSLTGKSGKAQREMNFPKAMHLGVIAQEPGLSRDLLASTRFCQTAWLPNLNKLWSVFTWAAGSCLLYKIGSSLQQCTCLTPVFPAMVRGTHIVCREQGALDARSWEVRRHSGFAVNIEKGSQTSLLEK